MGEVNFQGQGFLLVWITVGQEATAHAIGAGWGCFDIFLSAIISFFFFPLSERRPDKDCNIVSKGH